jgi:hypothetical protein
MMSLGVFRPVARQFVAAAAMFGFTLNVATPTIAHGCAHLAPAGVSMQAMSHPGHGEQAPDPAPSDQSSHGKKCQCVGQSCGTAFAIPGPVATGPRPAPVVVAHSLPVPSADRLPAVAQHLLPFAVGPPGSIPA